MDVRIEHGGLDRWVIKLDKAISDAPDEAAKVVERGALQIKNGARRRVGSPRHAPAYPSSITYETWRGMRGPVAEVGPDKNKRQGPLGSLIEFGSINNSPRPHMAPAVDEELPRFEKAMEDLAARIMEQ